MWPPTDLDGNFCVRWYPKNCWVRLKPEALHLVFGLTSFVSAWNLVLRGVCSFFGGCWNKVIGLKQTNKGGWLKFMSKMVEFGKATAQCHRPEVAVTTIAMPLVYVTCSVSWHHECFGTEKNILQWCKWTYEKLYLQPLAIGFWSRVYLTKTTTFKGQKGVLSMSGLYIM